jgi:hypothetical protein
MATGLLAEPSTDNERMRTRNITQEDYDFML